MYHSHIFILYCVSSLHRQEETQPTNQPTNQPTMNPTWHAGGGNVGSSLMIKPLQLPTAASNPLYANVDWNHPSIAAIRREPTLFEAHLAKVCKPSTAALSCCLRGTHAQHNSYTFLPCTTSATTRHRRHDHRRRRRQHRQAKHWTACLAHIVHILFVLTFDCFYSF